MNRTVKKIIAISIKSSKQYKIVTSVILPLYCLVIILGLQPIINDDNLQLNAFLLALLDTAVFFFITHTMLRSYLKINLINTPVSLHKITYLLGYLLLLSIFGNLLSYFIGKIEFFEFSDVMSLYVANDLGETKFEFSLFYIYLSAVLNVFFLLLGWAIIYLFWIQQINRKKQQKEMHQAQLQQLTNQLNPHFLFNAFNSIRALIYEDRDKAADTVTLLSELFRTHLKAHVNTKSSLTDELEVSSNYLAIEKIRLEDRLQLNITIDPQLNAQTLPTLTLLTLVENAIKHGISPNREAGYIDISASLIAKKNWLLKISNSVNAISTEDGTRTGQKNVKKRLRLMFGEQYQWRQMQKNGVYSVEMELPYD